MTKLTKLMNNPTLFFKDSFKKRKNQIQLLTLKKSIANNYNKQTNKETVTHNGNISKNIVKSEKDKKSITDSSDLVSLNLIAPDYSFEEGKFVYMHLPWIKNHGETLIKSINKSELFKIYSMKIVSNFDDKSKKEISQLACKNPEEYRNIVLSHLVLLKNKIQGFILTSDLHPVMRILVDCCKELNIKTILLPHESIFKIDKSYYTYQYGNFKINTPKCDYIITSGALQEKIFLDRRVNKDKILKLGSPKYDVYHDYRNSLTREEFINSYGLDPAKKVFLYEAQDTSDFSADSKTVILRQCKAISDIMEYCEKNDIQLIIRTANINFEIVKKIKSSLNHRFENNDNFIIGSSYYNICPLSEVLFHVDLVLGINSEVLFESMLQGTPTLSLNYIKSDELPIWNNISINMVANKAQLYQAIDCILEKKIQVTDTDEFWAEQYLLDGMSVNRIVEFLNEFAQEKNNFVNCNYYAKSLFSDNVQYLANSNLKIMEDNGIYLPHLLNFSHMVKPRNSIEASLCDVAIQWGTSESVGKKNIARLMKKYGKKPFVIEDGFIRSVGIGLTREPGLSITLGGETAYYDAYKESIFEKILNSNRDFSFEELKKARSSINLIINNRISKYNDSPYLPIQIGRENATKILVIDQRYGDQSVYSAKASDLDFQNMLIDAINNNPDADVIIKRHPDAIKGGKGSYFDDSRITFTKNLENVILIDYDIHPHQLLDLVEKVYVCSSGLGFEALLYDKEVICYGVPFYSNWGLTTDMKIEKRRNKKRTLEEVFYVSYIECSRYFSPKLMEACDIEDCIDYIVENRYVRVN